jgi:hypothetical protein
MADDTGHSEHIAGESVCRCNEAAFANLSDMAYQVGILE